MITVAFFAFCIWDLKKKKHTSSQCVRFICYYSNLVMNVSGKKSQLVKPLCNKLFVDIKQLHFLRHQICDTDRNYCGP